MKCKCCKEDGEQLYFCNREVILCQYHREQLRDWYIPSVHRDRKKAYREFLRFNNMVAL
jgi:hypothetical protein